MTTLMPKRFRRGQHRSIIGSKGVSKLWDALETGQERTSKTVGHLQTHAQQCREDKEQSHLATLEQLESIESEGLHQRYFAFLLLQLALWQGKAIGKEHKAQNTRH